MSAEAAKYFDRVRAQLQKGEPVEVLAPQSLDKKELTEDSFKRAEEDVRKAEKALRLAKKRRGTLKAALKIYRRAHRYVTRKQKRQDAKRQDAKRQDAKRDAAIQEAIAWENLRHEAVSYWDCGC